MGLSMYESDSPPRPYVCDMPSEFVAAVFPRKLCGCLEDPCVKCVLFCLNINSQTQWKTKASDGAKPSKMADA